MQLSIAHIIIADLSIIPYVLNKYSFYQSNIVSTILTAVTFFLGLLINAGNVKRESVSNLMYFIVVPLVLLIVIDVINASLYSNPSGLKESFIFLIKYANLLILFFLAYLIYGHNNRYIDKLLSPYLFLAILFSSFSVVAFLSVIFGIVDVMNWAAPESLSSMQNNWTSKYKFPLYLSMVMVDPTEVRYILNYPIVMFASWFKEPQLFAFFIMPALFLISYSKLKLKFLWILIVFFAILLTGSFTAFLFLFIIFVVNSVIKSKFNLHYMVFFITITITIIGLIVGNGFFANIDSGDIIFKLKFSPEEYSYDLLSNLLIADDLFGKTLFLSRSEQPGVDSSLSLAVAFVILYLSVFFVSIKIYFSKGNVKVYVFALMYVFFHSLKDFFGILIPFTGYISIIVILIHSTFLYKNKTKDSC